MAQFDVCRNSGRSRAGFPYLVIVQSRICDSTARRLVVPMTTEVAWYPAVAPAFDIEGRRVVADALLMFATPRDRLGPVIDSLADDARSGMMIGTIDLVISRAWG
jgi:hypothetical protein